MTKRHPPFRHLLTGMRVRHVHESSITQTNSSGPDISIRAAVDSNAEAIVALHFASVRHHGDGLYSPEIIDSWSPPPDERRWARMRCAIASDVEMVLVAEISGEVCGFGAVCAAEGHLRALYVHPAFGRRGVGSAILSRLESLAIAKGAAQLRLDASLNAEAFYHNRGFEAVERAVHRLSSGVEMVCVVMRKQLAQIDPATR